MDYVLDACACARQGTAALCEALDGGYVLLALPSNAPPEVFDHVKWSCNETANSQRERLQACGVGVRTLLGRWSDIDEVTDVHALLERLKTSKACPRVLAMAPKLEAMLAIWKPGEEKQQPPSTIPGVAPWAEFSEERQAQRLAELEAFNAKTPPTSPSTVAKSPTTPSTIGSPESKGGFSP